MGADHARERSREVNVMVEAAAVDRGEPAVMVVVGHGHLGHELALPDETHHRQHSIRSQHSLISAENPFLFCPFYLTRRRMYLQASFRRAATSGSRKRHIASGGPSASDGSGSDMSSVPGGCHSPICLVVAKDAYRVRKQVASQKEAPPELRSSAQREDDRRIPPEVGRTSCSWILLSMFLAKGF